jgi:hypothetical protein
MADVSAGEKFKVFDLHGKHERTVDTVQARAMPEPDSLGG